MLKNKMVKVLIEIVIVDDDKHWLTMQSFIQSIHYVWQANMLN